MKFAFFWNVVGRADLLARPSPRMCVIRGRGDPEVGAREKDFHHHMPQVFRACLAFRNAVAYDLNRKI